MTALRALAVVLALLPASGAAAKLRVVTTIETLGDLARRVGGDRVEVQSLARGSVDPHFVEPKPNLMVALARADALVLVGLDLEVGWLPPLVTGSRNRRIQPGAPGHIDASTAIAPLDVPARADRAMGDIHPRGNPHYWIPPDNAVAIARLLATRLAAIAPGDAAAFERGRAAFEAEVARRRPGWAARAAPLRGLPIATYHRSWSYVSRWLGLQEVGYVEPKPGVPASPREIAQLIGAMRSRGARVLAVEPYHPRRVAELVAQKAGARLVVLPADVGGAPPARDYFSLVDSVISALSSP